MSSRRHPGTDIPTARRDEPAGRNLLGLYRRLGIGWQISRYNFLENRWEGVRPFLGQPDEWQELPPVPPRPPVTDSRDPVRWLLWFIALGMAFAAWKVWG